MKEKLSTKLTFTNTIKDIELDDFNLDINVDMSTGKKTSKIQTYKKHDRRNRRNRLF
jgi:hypothetical protein